MNTKINLIDVLQFDAFDVNLIYVAKLTHDLNCSIIFYHDYCLIQDNYGVLIGMDFKENVLYIFSAKGHGDEESFQARTNLASIDRTIWHRRLGHLSKKKLDSIHVISSIIPKGNKGTCHTCPLAKQTRKTFPLSSNRASKAFELLHTLASIIS